MKQNKYIPGDWVKYKGKLAKVLETYKINYFIKTYHHDYNPDIEYDDAYFSVEARPQDIEPIPLTPEILEGIGWKWSEEHEEFASSSSKIAIYPESNYYVISDLYVKIRYAHQLQHLLFGLGLDSNFDLTDTKKGE